MLVLIERSSDLQVAIDLCANFCQQKMDKKKVQ